jgi:hypothetical protein
MQPQQHISLTDIHQILKQIPARQTGAIRSPNADSLPKNATVCS